APSAPPRPLGEGRVRASSNAPPAEDQPTATDPSTTRDGRAALPIGLVVLAAGPKPWRDPILALGAARLRPDGTLERWESLVRPPGEDGRTVRVPRYLADYGVVVAELEEAPPLARALDDLLGFVGDAPLAGLDLGVAVARLQYALRELGRPPLDNPLIELSVAADAK